MADCENASEAARRAGFWKDEWAHQQGWRLMNRPEVVAMVEEARAERAQRLRVTEERIIEAYAALAFGDARRVVTWEEDGSGSVTASEQLTEEEAMRVQAVERTTNYDKDGNPVTKVKVTLAPRQPALDALAKIKGMFRDKVEVSTIDGVAAEMTELRARRRARRQASEAAAPVDVEVIDAEPTSEIRERAAPLEPQAGPVPPGIARRFIATLPRE